MDYSIIELNLNNIDNEDVVCLRGKKDTPFINEKKLWMKKEFTNGLKFKKIMIEGRSWGFIEYIPGENAWRPVNADGYTVIHCHWIIGRYTQKGLGQILLNECLEDSNGMKGVVTVIEDKHLAADYKFYSRRGFEIVDKAGKFVLMAKKFKDNYKDPEFTSSTRTPPDFQGIYISYIRQCPYIEKSIEEMENVVKKYHLPYRIERLENSESVKSSTCPFGVCGIYYKGEFLTHEPLYESKFVKILSKKDII